MNALDLARECARCLGDGWSASEGHHGPRDDAFLYGPDGERLHVRTDVTPGRVSIGWAIPHELRQHGGRVKMSRSITASGAKSPEVIARDIARRLLPGLSELVARLVAAKAADENENAALAAFVDELAALPGAGRVSYSDHEVRGYNPYDWAVVALGSECQVTLRISRSDALRVMRNLLADEK